jgi:hypothetical protein
LSRHLFTGMLLLLGSCHLALGLETATEVEETGDAQCLNAGQCNDDNPCTDDDCVSGSCVNEPVPDGDAVDQTPSDCARAVCAGGALSQVDDGVDVPDDNKECTSDTCNGMMPSNSELAGGTPCNEDGGQVCDGADRCVECFSKDECPISGDECAGGGTANVCGCTPTTTCAGKTCGTFIDPNCTPIVDCNNNMQDTLETDVDCGGPTASCEVRCAIGKSCTMDADCAPNLMMMTPATCTANICV